MPSMGWVSRELEELRRPGLQGLSLAAMVVSWVWVLLVGRSIQWEIPSEALTALPPVLLFLSAALALAAHRLPTDLRCAIFLAGLTGTFVLAYRIQPAVGWLYGQVLVVTAAGPLASTSVTFAVSLLLTAGTAWNCQTVPGVGHWLNLLPPLGLLWATAITAWLSAQNLYTALGWALASQARAWQTANEARERRGELRRTLDSLRVTQGILERTLQELEAARAEAEEARRVKSRFVANISHELRTPLNVIVGFAEILCTLPETYGELPWPSTLREDVLTIWRNAEHLLSMIDDVLDLAQIEASRLPVVPEPTDLRALILDALAGGRPLVEKAGLELRISLPESLPVLSLDRARIRQVLLNLMNNAARFTCQGFVEVGAKVTDQDVIVYVRDTGRGIPADKLEVIFSEFEQVDTSIRRPHQGVGLGLAISRHFVSLHGGRIWAESQVGKGSTFYFSLPLVPSAATVQPSRTEGWPRAQAGDGKERGTLVVLCSDPLVVRLLERYLEGLQVQAVQTVDEAARLVSERHPEAVLIASETTGDLPDAISQARALLAAVAPLDLPVVVCTFPTERHAGMALDVREFLIKPITQKDLVAAVDRLCGNPRRILIADDDPDMLRLLERIVRRTWPQVEVLTAASGDEALALIVQRPDCLLLDLLMPGKSGIDVLRELRARPETAEIPVAVITARGPVEELATVHKGELYLCRNTCFAAGELMRVLETVTRALPPRYAGVTRGWPDIPEAAPA